MTDFNKYGIFPKTERENLPKKDSFLTSLIPVVAELLKTIAPKSSSAEVTRAPTTTPATTSTNPYASPSVSACRDYLKRHDYFVSTINKK